MTRRVGAFIHMAPEVMTTMDYGKECDVYS
jgi:hypothetical protein